MFSVWPQVKKSKIASGAWILALTPERLVADGPEWVPVRTGNAFPEILNRTGDFRAPVDQFTVPVVEPAMPLHSA